MLKHLRLLLVWLALAGLPLQGFAATTMAFCEQGAPEAPALTGMASHEHHGDSHPEQGTAAGHSTGYCADCTAPCHLCSALAIASPGASLVQDASFHYVAGPNPQPEGYLPDRPRRPPLA